MPLSLAERAYNELRDRIVTLEIRPGSPMRDETLGAELGVGRTPAREALKRLEVDRLVVTFPRRGTFATVVEATDLTDITEVRRELEPIAAAAAAERADSSQRSRLEELLAELLPAMNLSIDQTPSDSRDDHHAADNPGDPLSQWHSDRLIRTDMAIHRALYDATNNPYLRDTLTYYDNLATRIWCVFLNRVPAMADHVAEHRSLLRAVIDGDADGAAALSRAHLDHFDTAIRLAL